MTMAAFARARLVILLLSMFPLTCMADSAAQPPGSTHLKKETHGMVIDDDSLPAKPLTVGVGDTVAALVRRNPFLGTMGLEGASELRLPITTRFQFRYDDGDLRFDAGCVDRGNVSGNERFAGAAFVGMRLCRHSVGDWKAAVDIAADAMRRLRQQNPHLKDLGDFYRKASEPELQKVGGPTWKKSDHELYALLTLDEARAKLARQEAGGHEDIVSGRHTGSLTTVGIFSGEKALVEFGISKTGHLGGENLTSAERRIMRYEVSMSFRWRHDVNPVPSDASR
jgi:hypothetical protein